MPSVAILLATFNGERFIEEQLTSIANQELVRVSVYVNDDGSSDSTMQILEKWKTRGLVVSISESQRIGYTRAFLNLVKQSTEHDYIAFSDQDDIWERNKLIKLVEVLEQNIPMMAFSRRVYIKNDGILLQVSETYKLVPSFKNALVENVAPGNTTLLNREAIRLINRYSCEEIVYYDSWIYLLVSIFGKCKFVDEPLTRYRIHDNNTIGRRKWSLQSKYNSVGVFIDHILLLDRFSKKNFPPEILRDLDLILSRISEGRFFGIIGLFTKKKLKRQRIFENYLFALMLIFRIKNQSKSASKYFE